MKFITQVSILTIASTALVLSQKNEDDSRPYEFGFTIDGQQHRHESKDQKGIVQGEFGFITADGVYHVTVYATDENGNFKILSMKNIRISAPLDGSPATGLISPEAGKYLGKQAQPPAPSPQPLSFTPPAESPPVQPQQPPAQPQQIVTTQKPRAPYPFTTQPTIKPACAGCGFVTTQKSVPGQPFPFQNPIFQKTSGQAVEGSVSSPPRSGFQQNAGIQGAGEGQISQLPGSPQNNQQAQIQSSAGKDQNLQVPSDGQGPVSQISSIPQPQSVSQGQTPQSPQLPQYQSTNYQNSNNQGENQNQANIAGSVPQPPGVTQAQPQYQSTSYQSNNQGQNQASAGVNLPQPPSGTQNVQPQLNQNAAYQSNENTLGAVSGNSAQLSSGIKDVQPPGLDLLPPGVAPSSGPGPQPNALSIPGATNGGGLPQQQQTSAFPPVSVADNVIRVGGKNPQEIPIKDKFPGMQDGLPEGVEETDVKDLLYKFHYTVGFHGHYEKGLKNGAKIGGYFVNGRDGISRVVTYIADENGYRPKFKFINLGLDSEDTPKEGSEKKFGLKSFEFVWYPVE